MKSDNDFPRLVPPDDIFPRQGSLLRSPHDLPDDQFSLLAAAWAEGALTGESLPELESVIAADIEKRAFAESFMRLRLKPGTEKWEGRNRLLRSTPEEKAVRRTLIYTIAAAAVVLTIITLRPVAEYQATGLTPLVLPGVTVTADVTPPVAPAMQWPGERPADIFQPQIAEAEAMIAPSENEVINRDRPLEVGVVAETPVIVSGIGAKDLISLPVRNIPSPAEPVAERNWIVNSIAGLSKSRTKEDKPVDGYGIAGSLVKSVNTILGWEMELEKVSTDQGEPASVSFSSGLLTFSSPVKKSNQ